MTIAAETDPFTLVYNKIWEMIGEHPEVAALVKAGNLIKYTGKGGDRQTRKPALSESDVPEIRLTSESTDVNLGATSSRTLLTDVFVLTIRGGSLKYEVINAVRWAVLRACSCWADQLVTLEWNSKPFIVHGLPLKTQQRLLKAKEEEGGKMVWMSLLTYEVKMSFDTSDL